MYYIKLPLLFLLASFTSFFSLVTAAYTPVAEDRQWLNDVEDKIDDLYPMHVEDLVHAYDMIDSKKIAIKIAGGDRGLYLLQELKQVLAEKLFSQSDICVASHAQLGDTVELMYDVRSEAGTSIRKTHQAFAFNVGSEHVWKSLSVGVYGLQEGQTAKRSIKSVGVEPDPDAPNTKEKSFPLGTVKKTTPTVLYVGQEFVFGSPGTDAAIMGTIVSMDDDKVVFDFNEASIGRYVVMYTTLQSLIKSCN